MSESKHTPGPWHWEYDENGSHMAKLVGPEGQLICDFGVDEMYYPVSGTEPSNADMALMEVAPELLAFCLRLHEWAFIYHNRGQSASLESWCEIMVELNEVIAKATGGEA